ncbi:unnamed protein product [Didymodactylos carnosus]|uniref:U6 snRNA-associated Sm-like protein LSm4 n=1 Tax=Didymodactylos carnosus TaxID=1234261 RepID=A0A814EL47_9BILA|nr:unnamed protein product [Didymodactylos carnosus]CAF0970950.1 unnamed protein product [Didymodactylos carnosus]CAF3610974.1 unnamed protein product [Didymodactylos carnosus]CAF3744015.1 unnamed protein product [Didymodactylos carnosus]
MADKDKWQFLDKDGDQSLTYDEYFKFTRPEDNEDLRRMEINSMIKEYDTDNDGRVSNEEYGKMTEAESGQAESLSDELDANHDGFADYEEFARYYLPTSSITMDEETDHLMKECDTDKNGYCSADEIVNAYTSFAGSQVTDFGADLEDGHTELTESFFSIQLVELKNGETYNGHLQSCDNFMNIHLRDVICTSRDGDRFWKIPECYVRGNTIKYLRLPEEVINMVKEDSVEKQNKGSRGNERGGRGGSQQRGGGGGGRGRGGGRGGSFAGRGGGGRGGHRNSSNRGGVFNR